MCRDTAINGKAKKVHDSKCIGRLEPSNSFRAKWSMWNRPKSMKTILPDIWTRRKAVEKAVMVFRGMQGKE